MVNQEQFMNGILSYIDAEIMPSLPTAGKWELGTLILLGSTKYNEIFKQVASNSLLQSLEVVSPDGKIDVETLAYALKKSAEKYGGLEVSMPFVGVMKFSADDVEKVKRHILGGAKNGNN
ncbi:MAG: hypothetical protein KBT06_03490 [Prevotellaceae bacterium]|nr:hypothetical protein [Candidatus Colivivens equi]